MIPKAVRQFILERIDSIAHLEALLLLFRDLEKAWDAASVAKRLYISEQEATFLLNRLSLQGFAIEHDGFFQLRYDDEKFVHLLDLVADAYKKHLIPVTNLIHAKPSTSIREFAEAFKLRKDS